MQSSNLHGSGTEAVTNKLRELIMRGAFAPDERLTEMGLAKILDVSRTPVRLALATLEREELVVGVPNRGFRVRSFTVDDMIEMLELRATLEGMAARLAAERGTFSDKAAVFDNCIDRVEAILQEGTCDETARRTFVSMNMEFHDAISDLAGNSLLSRRLKQNPFRASPLMHILPAEEAFQAISLAQQDHKRLVAAISAKEGTRAEFLMREHASSPLVEADRIFTHLNKNNPGHVARLHAI